MTRPIIPPHMLDRPIGPDGLPYDPADGYPRVIWRHPERCFGRPCLHGTRVWQETVRTRVTHGDTVEQVAHDLDLNPEHVVAAVRRFTPILFTSPLVRAILDGHKTATRRTNTTDAYVQRHAPGTVLWVRESWWLCDNRELEYGDPGYGEPPRIDGKEVYYEYRADKLNAEAPGNWDGIPRDERPEYARWHPGVHMPARACRLYLTVTGCRVERLGDIDDAGVRAEGFANWLAFSDAFRQINKCSLDPDPLVTVIEFTASTTPPLGWGDYLDDIKIRKAKREPTP